ncbi:hypothetical protein TWF730_001639 [Orbilia blumenaviensis]|uniref:Uncharacterized protein n=1 Tax=Orbilia blumenaviensis TaxID=1796055 RepID=A0AAV9UJJ4_9PEZI
MIEEKEMKIEKTRLSRAQRLKQRRVRSRLFRSDASCSETSEDEDFETPVPTNNIHNTDCSCSQQVPRTEQLQRHRLLEIYLNVPRYFDRLLLGYSQSEQAQLEGSAGRMLSFDRKAGCKPSYILDRAPTRHKILKDITNLEYGKMMIKNTTSPAPEAGSPNITPTIVSPTISISDPRESSISNNEENYPTGKTLQKYYILNIIHSTSSWTAKRAIGFNSWSQLQSRITNHINAVAQVLDIDTEPKIVNKFASNKPGWQRQVYKVELQPDLPGSSRIVEVAHDYITGKLKDQHGNGSGRERATSEPCRGEQANHDLLEHWESWVTVTGLYS